MSGMSRTEHLRRMLARRDCYFVGDKKSGRYHYRHERAAERLAFEDAIE